MAKKALAVGVNAYGFPNDLPNCTRDAEAFGNLLETVYRFDHVRVVKDAEATREGVERGLEWLLQNATANDRLVFYFSGHGCRFERSAVIEEALVLHDGRLLDEHALADRMDNVPPGVLSVILDCGFSGLDELLLHPSGEVEVARIKHWAPIDVDRGRSDRWVTPGPKAYTPFGHVKPASLDAIASQLRSASLFDVSPARLVSVAEPQARAVLVLPGLADEPILASSSQTDGLSPFTYCLINEIRRLGPNRSTLELLYATGHELRRLGIRQTPLVEEPLHPERLGLRSFLTFQPVPFVYPPPGSVREGDIKEGRSMLGTMQGSQTFAGEDIGTIVNTVTPIVASVLQSRASQQPYTAFGSPMMPGLGWQSAQGWPSGFGQGIHGQGAFGQGGFGAGFGHAGFGQAGFGQRGFPEEIGQVVATVIPAVVAGLQQRQYSPYQQGWQLPQMGAGLPFTQGYGMGFPQLHGQPSLPPYEIAQLVSVVTPIVAALIQNKSYQGHFGQFMPRLA